MGRRSSPNQWPFYRSVLSWFVPWALVAVIVGIGVWVAVDALSGGANNPNSSASLAAGSSSSSSASGATKGSPTAAPSTSATPSPEATPTPKPPLITDGITVQVLNGTSDPTAAERKAAHFARLGFKIVAVGSSVTPYSHTTVFWASPASKPAAKALAAHFGWIAAPKPANLSPDVAVHVVVGADAL
jgi:LytR cell envelope-related transcriptional attenuator